MAEAETKPDQEAAAPVSTKREGVPFEIPVLPLTNTTLFPETMVPLAVGRPASMAAVEAALSSEEKLLACVSVRPDKTSDGDAEPEDLYEVGTLVMIKRMERVEDTLHLIVQGADRIKVLEWVQREPMLRARVQILPELEVKNKDEVEAAKRNVQGLIQQALAYLPQVPPEVRMMVLSAEDPVRLAYFLGSILSLGVDKEQHMLEANTVDELMHLAHDFLAREVEIIRLRSKIASEAQVEMDKSQRDYILRQQMNVFYAGNNGRSGYMSFGGRFTAANAINPAGKLVGEADFVLVADAREHGRELEPLQPALGADVLHAFGDQHPAGAAQADPRAVENARQALVDLDVVLHGLGAEVGALRYLDLFLFFADVCHYFFSFGRS